MKRAARLLRALALRALLLARARGGATLERVEYPACAPAPGARLASVPRLRVLRAPGEAAAWDAYLARVYGGALARASYPVDLNAFEWFYHHSPLGALSPARVDPRCAVPAGTAWTGPDRPRPFPEAIATRAARGFFVQRRGGGADGGGGGAGPPAPAARGEWIEVMRAAMPRAQSAQMRVGVWYWRAIGSGVFLAAGNATAVVDGAAQAWWDEAHLRALRAAGVQTVQAPSSGANLDYPMRNERFEIVDLRAGDFGVRGGGEGVACAGGGGGAGAPSPLLRTGFAAERPCHCNESLGFVNCRAAPRARRRRRLRPG